MAESGHTAEKHSVDAILNPLAARRGLDVDQLSLPRVQNLSFGSQHPALASPGLASNRLGSGEAPPQYKPLVSPEIHPENNVKGRSHILKLDTDVETPSNELLSPFGRESALNTTSNLVSRSSEATNTASGVTTKTRSNSASGTTAPALTRQDSMRERSALASPAASSLMEGLAADMQARILALQQSRSSTRRPTISSTGTPTASTPHLSRTTSFTNQTVRFRPNGPLSAGPAPLSSPASQSVDEQRTNFPGLSAFNSASNSRRTSQNSLSKTVSVTSGDSFDEEEDVSHEQRPTFAPSRPKQDQSQSQSQEHDPDKDQGQYQPQGPQRPLGHLSLDSKSDFDPSKHCAPGAPTGGALALGRTPSVRSQQRSSLSQRRGMRLNMSSPTGNMISTAAGQPKINEPRLPGSESRVGPEIVNERGQEKSGKRGDFGKYIDVESGRLKFANKAVVHSQGIEFSGGSSFRISLDDVEVLDELGSGNYGTVSKVLHKPTNTIMAMKEIRLELDDASFRQIIMELDVLHRCNIANIVHFYGAFFVESAVYICMEYMDGGSLNKICEGGIPEPYLKWIVYSVVQCLKQLKEEFNIIHRDVKPTNMLSSTNGDVKLCDFGVSGNLVASIAKTNIGCQAYMAPERIRGGGGNSLSVQGMSGNTYTVESDVWSLGLSIIEIGEGSFPYPPETYSNIFSQLSAIVDGKPPRLDPKRFSAEACEFVSQLVVKNPHQRPRYADMLKHPWLANEDWSKIDMGAFVRERLQKTNEPTQAST